MRSAIETTNPLLRIQTTTNHRVAAGQSGRETRLLYAGDLYRRKSVTGAQDEHTVRIPTPDGLVIEATLKAGTPDEPSNHEYRFLQTDYLGSVLGVSAEDGSHIASAAYTPFGEPSAPLDSWGGFGGFEQDSDLGLVNMRGRIYDPHLGRFLSPDPVIADPLASQSWNRYSYVSNSPLNAIDPSGFEEDWLNGISFGTEPIALWPAGTSILSMGDDGTSWGGSDPFRAIATLSINSGAGSMRTGMTLVSFSYGSDIPTLRPPAEIGFTDFLPISGPIHGAGIALNAAMWANYRGDTLGAAINMSLFALNGGVLAFELVTLGSGGVFTTAGRMALRGGVLAADGGLNGARAVVTEAGAAARAIPELSPNIARTFANGEYVGSSLTQDMQVFRAEGAPMGRWFGTIAPESAAQAEQMYNVVEYGNDLTTVSRYVIPRGTTVYTGPVAGGTGVQVFVGDPHGAGVRLMETAPLPQYGF